MRSETLKQETQIEALKAAPAVGGAVIASLTLNEWVAIATLIYVVLQTGLLLIKYYEIFKSKSQNKGRKTPDKDME